MQPINDEADQKRSVPSPWASRKDDALRKETAQFLARLDFRHASSHLNQKNPGYYLILLRNELRHRSLREKPALTD